MPEKPLSGAAESLRRRLFLSALAVRYRAPKAKTPSKYQPHQGAREKTRRLQRSRHREPANES